MRLKAVMFTLCSAEFLFAGPQMSVYVCNLDNVRESIVANAKAETEAVYRSAGVEIVWRECGESSTPASQANCRHGQRRAMSRYRANSRRAEAQRYQPRCRTTSLARWTTSGRTRRR